MGCGFSELLKNEEIPLNIEECKMRKIVLCKFLISAALIISLLSLTSCKYNKVSQYNDTEDIIYNNTKYIRTEHCTWSCDREKLYEIGWVWYIPPLGVTKFYSDNTTSPDFIYCIRGRNVWLKDGYDYEQEIFEIDNTNIKTMYADVFSNESVEYFDFFAEETTGFTWHPASHPELKNSPSIFEKNGLYYIRFAPKGEAYLIKDSFLKILRDNNILQ